MSETYYSRDNPISREQPAEELRVNGPMALGSAARAINNVAEQLARTLAAFESHSIPYAIADGIAVSRAFANTDRRSTRLT